MSMYVYLPIIPAVIVLAMGLWLAGSPSKPLGR
jgi:hypothetical protein